MPNQFLPEGRLFHTVENQSACATYQGVVTAMAQGQILEGYALLCTTSHDLKVSFGPFVGRMPRDEVALATGTGNLREIAILSRVGKPISFVVTAVEGTAECPTFILSRRRAQVAVMNYFATFIAPGTVVPATVTHMEHFGAFVDVGCGLTSMIGIEHCSVSRIAHPQDRFIVGQKIYALVRSVDSAQGRIYLSHKELLGTWLENVAHFSQGMTVAGYVRGVKSYGAFVELTPNLSGLAELRGTLEEGQRVSVYIKSIVPQAMKIKLIIIDTLPPLPAPLPLDYTITEGVLHQWRYSPSQCKLRGGETIF